MNTHINPPLRLLAAVAALAIFPACDGEPLPDAPTPPSTADQTPAPVASLTLSTGQVVEVYELGDRALLSETGIAGLPPVLDAMGETSADKLVEFWQRLAPDRAVPASVVGLQHRLLSRTGPDLARPPKVRLAPEIAGLEMPEQPVDAPEGTLAAPVGCYNGCCDYEWLRTFGACNSSDRDYQWFHYNYGWSSVKVYDSMIFDGFACAAVGTSKYTVNVEGGEGGTWTLPERYYRKFRDVAPLCCNDPDIVAKVNTSTAQALHTHCGRVWY